MSPRDAMLPRFSAPAADRRHDNSPPQPSRRLTLTELANRYGSDKGDEIRDRHGYTYVYDLIFGPSRDKPIVLLEIGLAIGGPETSAGRLERRVDSPSVAMWLEYFTEAQIVGFDISDFSHIRHERFSFVRGDAGDRDHLHRLSEAAPAFDIIIDDGSHASYHQQHCLKHLWPSLKSGGLYIIEDLHWQSPVYEAALPDVPRSADLFESAFRHERLFDSALFSSEELARLRTEVETFSIFRDVVAGVSVPKLLVLRKRGEGGAQSVRASSPLTSGAERSVRRELRSFDLFDTLIARRCVQPHAVFDLVEQRLGLTGFAALRIAAEAGIAHREYTLQDIYDAMALRWPDLTDRLSEARDLEIETEIENLFPIPENIAKVSPGDIVVSDMYLPADVVEVLVRSVAGLRDAGVYVSSHGKRRGTVWKALEEQFRITHHLGDNPDTDIVSPTKFGIPATLTRVAEMTAMEASVAGRGLPSLARAMREARLRSWHGEHDARQLQLLQVGVNLPMLLVAAVLVLRAARERDVSRILASGRDCYLWSHLLRFLQDEFAPGVQTEYFFTGRIPRSFPSVSYAGYVRHLLKGEKAFVLDICGTGWSLQRMCEQLDLTNVQPVLIQMIGDQSLRRRYEGWGPTRCSASLLTLLDSDRPFDNEIAELANPAPHPTVLDVALKDGQAAPLFADIQASREELRTNKIQDEAFLSSSCFFLGRPVLDELSRAPSDLLSATLEALYGSYDQFRDAFAGRIPEHRLQDAAVCRLLAEMGEKWRSRAA
ncbi:hypothetical protein [Muricoccus pecuniae]|uniref:Methyltransferase domain-containing protein n=1 Tax=Muricoccus pecuniae TaxID=693023 RepID=A0A840YER5_9PROT|nr:hypothetical protein [Roseomonas pecuniae]MBB5694867.1 hypothetical protein [Roseomonas pecuniae]